MRLFFTLLCFITLSSPLYSETCYLYSGHPDYPPYMWLENKQLTGVGVEIVQEIFKELKLKSKSLVIPSWERVQQMTKEGKIDILVGAYKSTERMKYMYYSIPYADDPTHIFIRKDATFSFQSIQDLIGKRGGAIYGESLGKELDKVIKTKLNVTRIYNPKALIENLKQKHIDYAIWGYYPWILNQDTSAWCKISDKPITTEGMYITISKKSTLSKYLPQINDIIKRLKAERKIKKWLKEYSKKYQQTAKPNKK